MFDYAHIAASPANICFGQKLEKTFDVFSCMDRKTYRTLNNFRKTTPVNENLENGDMSNGLTFSLQFSDDNRSTSGRSTPASPTRLHHTVVIEENQRRSTDDDEYLNRKRVGKVSLSFWEQNASSQDNDSSAKERFKSKNMDQVGTNCIPCSIHLDRLCPRYSVGIFEERD